MNPSAPAADRNRTVALTEEDVEAAVMLLSRLIGIERSVLLAARLSADTTPSRPMIVQLAERMRRLRLRRRALFPQPIFGEPPWEMLLALYVDHPDGATIATLASGVGLASTTARRWLGYLKDHELVRYLRSERDRRSYSVVLTDGAREKLEAYFDDADFR